MSALTFSLKAAPARRLDLSPLTPDRLRDLKQKEILGLALETEAEPLLVDDVFEVKGSDAAEIRFEGGSARFDLIGHAMSSGSIQVFGDVGYLAGRHLRGGHIAVNGDAGALLGSQMAGGRITLSGNAGASVGGPLSGELSGMSGGLILIGGKAGERAGERMRRGMIVVSGPSGDYAGTGMIAGTLVLLGKTGHLPGYLMRRGTIVLGRGAQSLSPSFADCGPHELAFAALLGSRLVELEVKTGKLFKSPLRRYAGDLAALGKGEILLG
ncbi:MAG TPA: formylmethanofuran dehydrogenase subunit C [Aestuariivirgaceae bacterium]|nr:formylmethanofuran dehydrogenase subunit C [Aestuariivirgaceae bacterium]